MNAIDGTAAATGAAADYEDSSAVPLSIPSVAIAFSAVSISVVLSRVLDISLESSFIVGAVRATLQLAALGYILSPVFAHPSWWATFLIVNAMGLVAAGEAYRRAKYRFKGMVIVVWLSVFVPSACVLSFALIFVIRIRPVYLPQYAVPLFGMYLNNCLNSVSVGFSSFLAELAERKHVVENLLSRGATRWEAVRPLVFKSMRTGLTSTLNSMNVIGIVSIPGMMTGQILGGNSPEQAARYQMVITYLVCTVSTVGLSSAIAMAVVGLFDGQHRLLSWKLAATPQGSGIGDAWRRCRSRIVCCCRRARARDAGVIASAGG